jgi:hypothetical protein
VFDQDLNTGDSVTFNSVIVGDVTLSASTVEGFGNTVNFEDGSLTGQWSAELRVTTEGAGGLILKDGDDPTKQARFDATQITTETARVYTFPDADGTLALQGAITTSGLTQATARILGRTTASTGAVEEIEIGSGLSLSAGELSATGGGGSSIMQSIAVGFVLN